MHRSQSIMAKLLAAAVAIPLWIVPMASFADGADARVTFTRDVAPILMENCVDCHRPGQMASMSLLTYEDARPWAKSIKDYVVRKEMPPWQADPRYGKFKNDIRMEDEEIATIAKWVDQGAAEGDPADMPPAPEYADDEWPLGEPDYIIELDEIAIPADGPDLFPTPMIKIDMPESRWVRAIDVRPGDRSVLHHVVFFMSGAAMGGGRGGSGFFDVLSVWAVGSPPNVFPEGMGRWIEKGANVMANIHYHPSGTATTDRTRVGLYFGEGELKKQVHAALPGNVTFLIPPGDPNHEVTASYFVDQDIRITSLFPHMHLRGKDMKITATLPDGEERILISVPKYDFDWQWFYYPEEEISLPRGTKIEVLAHYDNSADNPDNPDPTKSVTFGLQSTDEMMFGLFEFVLEEGVAAEPSTPEERLKMIAAEFPSDTVYLVELNMGTRSMPALLVLPREGVGKFYIAFGGQSMDVPVENIAWSGEEFSFEMNLGEILGGSIGATGTVAEDGSLKGRFEMDSEAAAASGSPVGQFLQLGEFEGTRGI